MEKTIKVINNYKQFREYINKRNNNSNSEINNEINITYNIKNENSIHIFGKKFVENN